jgi:hypothetical protein
VKVGIKHGIPFQYLDDFCSEVNWAEVHTDTVRGLAKVQWIKTVVSAGVHPDWATKELYTYLKEPEVYLTKQQLAVYKGLTNIEQEIKFLSMMTPLVHPFWLCFLRVNKAIEPTYHENKADAATCVDTPSMVYFPKLMSVIRKLPMKSIGRILIFMTEANNETVPHRDASVASQLERPNADFIWFQPQAQNAIDTKKIFIMSDDKEKFYPDPSKKFVWFNELDYHGTEPSPTFSYSVRVEGVFNDLVRPAS